MKEKIEIPLVKATYEELQEVICELQVERYEKDKEIEKLVDELEEQERHIKEANVEIKRLENIIKEVREYIEEKEKDDDNWIDYELCIEPIVIKEILDKENKEC